MKEACSKLGKAMEKKIRERGWIPFSYHMYLNTNKFENQAKKRKKNGSLCFIFCFTLLLFKP
jgi:hypothetical protein